MNAAPPSSGFKLLFRISVLITCGLIGYYCHPYLQTTPPEELSPVASKPETTDKIQEVEPIIAAEPETIKGPAIEHESIETKIAESKPSSPVEETPDTYVSPPAEKPLAKLTLIGTQASSTQQRARDSELLKQAIESGDWVKYRSILHQSIISEFSKIRLGKGSTRYDEVWKEDAYYQAVLRSSVLEGFPTAVLSATKTTPNNASFMSWLMVNNSAMEEILLTLRQQDDKASVFEFLGKVWGKYKDSPELADKYFNLALACAVVFDEKLSYKNSDSYNTSVDGLARFLWYVEKNEGGLTEVSIDKSSARDLTFVVCSPVSEKELEWALKKFRILRRKSFGNTYGQVEYLMERAVEGLNPYKEYTLPEILKEGGICGDQSYFCVNSARAAGIPACTLVGETSLGGHAWAAVKTEHDAWSTKIGRVGGVSEGKANDPQGGPNINEQAIWLWSTREHQSRSNLVKVHRLLWLSDSIDSIQLDKEKSDIIKVAHIVGQQFPSIWKRMYNVLLADDAYISEPTESATVKLWSEFVKAMKLEFKRNPRMAALAKEVEDQHIFPYADLNDVRRQLARDRRRSDRDSQEQADLITTSLKRESQLLLARDKDNALREIGQLYDRALRDFGGSVSGFRTMAQDYFNMTKHNPKSAEKAVGDIENAFQRVVETGTKNWFRANAEIGLHKLICQMYREIGEVKRAENMEKRLERELKRAKRSAL
jgi:hypothetical protein